MKVLMDEGEDIYEAYLDMVFERSGFKHIWTHLKRLKKYSQIPLILKR